MTSNVTAGHGAVLALPKRPTPSRDVRQHIAEPFISHQITESQDPTISIQKFECQP